MADELTLCYFCSLFKSYARRVIFHVVLCYFMLLFVLLKIFVSTELWVYILLCNVSGGFSCHSCD